MMLTNMMKYETRIMVLISLRIIIIVTVVISS